LLADLFRTEFPTKTVEKFSYKAHYPIFLTRDVDKILLSGHLHKEKNVCDLFAKTSQGNLAMSGTIFFSITLISFVTSFFLTLASFSFFVSVFSKKTKKTKIKRSFFALQC
jgi:hypothetical protein